MRSMLPQGLGLAVMLLAGGCASVPQVQTDHDPQVDFSRYHSYRWIAPPDGAPPLVAQRITAAVDTALGARGWTLREDGEVALAAHVATSQRQSVDTFYDSPSWAGWGWRGGWGGMGMSHTQVRTYEVGTLVLDMFDSASKRAIWRGTASQTVPSTPEKVNAAIPVAVEKILAGFPPGTQSPQ